MKTLTYQYESVTEVFNDETGLVEKRPILIGVNIENPTEDAIARAAEIAYNGEYTIDDDGQPDPVVEPTESERIAELEEALALLLSGVTE